MINLQTFLTNIVAAGLFKTLTEKQQDSITAILNECVKQGCIVNQMAYIFATAYHECYNPRTPETRLTPMVEFGGEKYLKAQRYYPYYGRGFSQLTWDYNYKKEGERLGLDLLKHPELILDINIAANSHVYCMMNGRYTSRKLLQYVNATSTDYVNARRVVNGTDKAVLISGYAMKFESALLMAAEK
jgi:hypothetical protein